MPQPVLDSSYLTVPSPLDYPFAPQIEMPIPQIDDKPYPGDEDPGYASLMRQINDGPRFTRVERVLDREGMSITSCVTISGADTSA